MPNQDECEPVLYSLPLFESHILSVVCKAAKPILTIPFITYVFLIRGSKKYTYRHKKTGFYFQDQYNEYVKGIVTVI